MEKIFVALQQEIAIFRILFLIFLKGNPNGSSLEISSRERASVRLGHAVCYRTVTLSPGEQKKRGKKFNSATLSMARRETNAS